MSRQPPVNTPINRSHSLGRYVDSIIIPGWSEAEATTTGSGAIYRQTFDNRRIEYSIFELGVNSTGTAQKKTLPYRTGQTVTAIQTVQEASDVGWSFKNTDSDYGPFEIGDALFSVVCIHKPVGDGMPGANQDPRLWSKDIGDDLADHDLMIGYTSSGTTNIVPRMRFRTDGGGTPQVTTAIADDTSANDITNDDWNLICGIVEPNGSSTRGRMRWVNANGVDGSTTFAATGTYDPRNTTAEGCWNTVGDIAQDRNGYDGTILCVYFFRGIALSEANCLSLFDDPWQIFERRTILVPTFPYLPYTPYDPNAAPPSPVTITDVNTTESWNDGDTGLVITGTGFM